MTAASVVIHYDRWWNPAVEAQAIDRSHRIGQTQPVFAYRMIASDTVEEKLLQMQQAKRDLAEAILSGEGKKSLRDLTIRAAVAGVVSADFEEQAPPVLALDHRVVGVDGRYGRHYSFLKAVAALWQVAVDPAVLPLALISRTAFEHGEFRAAIRVDRPLVAAREHEPHGDRQDEGQRCPPHGSYRSGTGSTCSEADRSVTTISWGDSAARCSTGSMSMSQTMSWNRMTRA